jgi:Sulfotransferase domain
MRLRIVGAGLPRTATSSLRKIVPPQRLLEWRAAEGWLPICRALSLPVPDRPFPWVNQRSEWVK